METSRAPLLPGNSALKGSQGSLASGKLVWASLLPPYPCSPWPSFLYCYFVFSNKIELFTFFELSIPTTSSSFSTLSVGNGVEFGKSLRGTKKMEVTACRRDKVALPTLERGFQEPASQSSEGAREVTLEESRGQARVTLHPCRQQA